MKKTFFISVLLLAPHLARAQWVRDTVLCPMCGVWSLATLEDTLYVSAGGTILRSTDEGATWQNRDRGLIRGYAYFPFTNYGRFFLANVSGIGFPGDTNYGKLFRSTDAGETWLQVNVKKFFLDINALTTIGDTLYTPGLVGLFRSPDSGATWSPATDSANSGLLAGSHVHCFLTWRGMTYAGSDTGIFVTTDRGGSWHPLPSNDTLRDVPSLVSLGRYIFAVGNDRIFCSLDSGRSWQYLPNLNIVLWPGSSLGIIDGKLLASNGLASDVYCSSDSGQTWQFFGNGLGSTGAFAVFCSTRKFVFLNYASVFLYRRPLSDFEKLGVTSSNTAVSVFLFPSITSGAVTIHASTEVKKITIFNVLGNKVLERTGTNSPDFQLDLSQLPPGVYWGCITMPGVVALRRIVKE